MNADEQFPQDGYGDDEPPNQRLIRHDARQRLLYDHRAGANLAIADRVMRAGESLELPDRTLKIERDSVLVFRDEAPLENWGHQCRYIFYDPGEGLPYHEVAAQFPPELARPAAGFTTFHEPLVHPRPGTVLWTPTVPRWPLRPVGRWYAVLFSGASNNRHTNDLEYLYRVLRDDFRLPADRIYTLNYDGTLDYSGAPHPVAAWPGDGSAYRMPVNAAGTKLELEAVLDELAGRLRPNDSLLIHTNNHGGRDEAAGKSFLCCHSAPDYYEDELALKLAELPRIGCLMVMMEQCYAGGFNQPIIDHSPAQRTSVASAANATSTSIGGPDFDPFARDWISAMNQAGPDGSVLAFNPESDADGTISAREAFDYADAVHHPHDTPVYSQSSAAAGGCRLGRRARWLPHLPLLMRQHDWRLPYPLLLEELERRMPELERELDRDDLTVREAEELIERRLGELIVPERPGG